MKKRGMRSPDLVDASLPLSPVDRMMAGSRILAKRKPAASIVATEEILDDEICRVAHVMACLWASEGEIAAALGISLASFNELRDRHVELAEAVRLEPEANGLRRRRSSSPCKLPVLPETTGRLGVGKYLVGAAVVGGAITALALIGGGGGGGGGTKQNDHHRPGKPASR